MTTTTVHVDTDTGEVTAEGDHAGLFNGAAYQTPVPTLDGQRADTLKLAFAGGVEIDIKIADDLEWFKSLRFGQEIEMTVTATVSKTGWAIKNSGDDGEKVTHTLGLNVHSYELVDSE